MCVCVCVPKMLDIKVTNYVFGGNLHGDVKACCFFFFNIFNLTSAKLVD